MKHTVIARVHIPAGKRFVTINKAGTIHAKGKSGRAVIGHIKRKSGMRYWVKANGHVIEAPAIYLVGKKRLSKKPARRSRR